MTYGKSGDERDRTANLLVADQAFRTCFNFSIFAGDKSWVAGVELATASEPPARKPRIWGRRPPGVDPSHPCGATCFRTMPAEGIVHKPLQPIRQLARAGSWAGFGEAGKIGQAMAFTPPRLWYDESWVLARIDAPDDPGGLTIVDRLSGEAVELAT